jgi:hypothetical protein
LAVPAAAAGAAGGLAGAEGLMSNRASLGVVGVTEAYGLRPWRLQ